MVRLIAADMDGTLLDSEKKLPGEFFSVLEKLKSEHVFFTVASGRQYYNLRKQFGAAASELYFLAENGAVIFHGSKNLFINEIEPKQLPEIVETIRQVEGAHPILCGLETAYLEDGDDFFIQNARMYYERLEIVPDILKAAQKDKICKVAAFDAQSAETKTFPLLKKFDAGFGVTLSGKMWVDVMNPGINKGTGIRFLQNLLGVSFAETMAFGDYLNDLEMMRECEYSFAMANAHPELKNICRYETTSNDDNGVLNAINAFFHFSR